MSYINHGEAVEIVLERLPDLNTQLVGKYRVIKVFEHRDILVLEREQVKQEPLAEGKVLFEEPYRVFFSQDFMGLVPQPVLAVVVASNKVIAKARFERRLLESKLPTDLYTLKEVDLHRTEVRILNVDLGGWHGDS